MCSAAIVIAFLVLSAVLTLLGDPRDNVDDWMWGVVSVLYFGGLASYFVLLREAAGRPRLGVLHLHHGLGDR